MLHSSIALTTGETLRKEQTGLLHYCLESREEGVHDTIPLTENALYALALFRSRLSDQVLEGKRIIEKVLSFQTEGNFPIYLHEYPVCRDPFAIYRLVPVFFWILSEFSPVIGGLKETLGSLLSQLKKPEGAPKWVLNRLLSLEGKIGEAPATLFEWGEELSSLQIAHKNGAEIQERLSQAAAYWHADLGIYQGPSPRRNQERGEPALSLFELFFAHWTKNLQKRHLNKHPLHLRAAEIRLLPIPLTIAPSPLPLELFEPGGETPFFLGWKGESYMHTLVLAAQNVDVKKGEGELFLTYPEELFDEDDKQCEWSLYLNHHPDHEFFVEGEKANTFQAGEQLEICSKGVKITLSFHSEEGHFFGHILRGNRPSQHSCRGKEHFTSYDWRVAIRTIDRKRGAKLRLSYAVVPVSSCVSAGESTATPIACIPLST